MALSNSASQTLAFLGIVVGFVLLTYAFFGGGCRRRRRRAGAPNTFEWLRTNDSFDSHPHEHVEVPRLWDMPTAIKPLSAGPESWRDIQPLSANMQPDDAVHISKRVSSEDDTHHQTNEEDTIRVSFLIAMPSPRSTELLSGPYEVGISNSSFTARNAP